MDKASLEAILGRPELPIDSTEAMKELAKYRVLITGGEGSIGRAIQERLPNATITDLKTMDVRNEYDVYHTINGLQPRIIFHLAAHKHAPAGEELPTEVSLTNIIGTANVVQAASKLGAHVVTASTCKAADPETAYGASKLIAEKITLNAGFSVVRLYNVVQTQGNIFEIWSGLPEDQPLPVTNCERFFISLEEAVSLLLTTALSRPGRYTFTHTLPRNMRAIALALHPGRELVSVPPRRGDRLREPRIAKAEDLRATGIPGLGLIRSYHDGGDE